MTGLAEFERARLPVLTEIVELPPDAVPATHAEPPVPAPPVAAAGQGTEPGAEASPWTPPPAPVDEPAHTPAVDADALAQQVLAALQPRLDAWFEARVRDALAPALERLADGAAAEARAALGASLRALLADAVAQALAERHPR